MSGLASVVGPVTDIGTPGAPPTNSLGSAIFERWAGLRPWGRPDLQPIQDDYAEQGLFVMSVAISEEMEVTRSYFQDQEYIWLHLNDEEDVVSPVSSPCLIR
jgi:hypothetical protein